MYWSFGTFLFSLIFSLVVLVLSIVAARKSKDDAEGYSFFASAVIGFFIISTIVAYSITSGDLNLKNQLIEEINNTPPTEDVIYHKVEYIGTRWVLQNPADKRWYVDMGNGSMVSFDRIVKEEMCRTCVQFLEPDGGKFVYLYRVQKKPKGFFNSDAPVLYFSKGQDIYLQSMQTINVEEQTLKQVKH